MKKLILTTIIILIAIVSQAQVRGYTVHGRVWVKTDSLLIIKGDTIGCFYYSNGQDTVVSKHYVDSLISALPGGHNAVSLNLTATNGGLSLVGQELGFQSATPARAGYMTASDFLDFYNKLGVVTHNNTLTGNGTVASPLKVDTTIMAARQWVLNQNYIGDVYLHYDSLAGTPTIPEISNIAYDALTWNENFDGASKNAIRDKIESLAGGHDILTLSDSALFGGLSLDTTLTQQLDFQRATSLQNGFTTSTDWNTFNRYKVDSAGILRWSDTLHATKGVATAYDISSSQTTLVSSLRYMPLGTTTNLAATTFLGDLNDVDNGVFYTNSSSTHRPADTNGTVLSFSGLNNYGYQIGGYNNLLYRRNLNGTWTDWFTVWSSETSNLTSVNWSSNINNSLQYNLNGTNITTAGTLQNVAYKGALSTGYMPYYNSTGTALQNTNHFYDGTNTGIGSVAPLELFQLSGALKYFRITGATETAYAGTYFTNSTGINEFMMGVGGKPSYSSGYKITPYTTGASMMFAYTNRWQWYVNSGLTAGALSAELTPKMTLTETGLGIGTVSPGEKLEVNGKTKTTNLQITSGANDRYYAVSDSVGNATWEAFGNDTVFAGKVIAPTFEATDTTVAPFVINSTAIVENLNVEFLNGQPGSYYIDPDSLIDNELQVIDTFLIENDTIKISLEQDGEIVKMVSLKPYVNDTLTYAMELSFSSTVTHDYDVANNSILTLTGQVSVYTLENVPDGGFGDIVLIQDGTGGYGVATIESYGLEIMYQVLDTTDYVTVEVDPAVSLLVRSIDAADTTYWGKRDDLAKLNAANTFTAKNTYSTSLTFNNDRDIVDKGYVDAIAAGNSPKLPVDAATTANITLSGTQTIDSYAVTAGMRVLVKNQSTAAANGVYTVAAGAWSRTTDLDTWAELYKAYVVVLSGGQSGSSFVCTIASSGTLESDAITWVLYTTPVSIVAGNGIDIAGNTISAEFGGPGSATTVSRSDHTQAATTIGAGSVSDTEFGYIDGITSAIQTQINAKEPTLTKGNLTETVTGLQFNATRQVIGGALELSASAGYAMPTTTNITEWSLAHSNMIDSLRVTTDGGTKTIMLYQKDLGTITGTFTDNSASYWTQGTGYIVPATLTDEVRIGSATDNGNYKLQVAGSAYFSSLIKGGPVSYIELADLEGDPSSTPSGFGNFYVKSDKPYFRSDAGVTYDLTTGGTSMVYPGAGIPVSTGSAWGTSKTTPAGTIVGTTDTQALTNKTVNGVTLTTGGVTTAFLNQTGTYTTPAGGGDVSKVGTPVNDQVAVWTGNGTAEGSPNFTFDGTSATFAGNVISDATRVQALNTNSSTVTLNAQSGYSAIITVTTYSSFTLSLSNLTAGTSGNITIINAVAGGAITLSGYTNIISPKMYSAANIIASSGSSKVDMISWYYDGTRLIWNGDKDYR